MAEKLSVKLQRFGPSDRVLAQALRRLARSDALGRTLRGSDNRLLAVDLVEPARKLAKPAAPDRIRATYYDYERNRTVRAVASLAGGDRVEVSTAADQPNPSREEFEAAVAVVSQDRELGAAIRDGALQVYEPMPPVIASELPDGTIERTLAVGLLPARGRRRLRHEIVGVNMIHGRLERFERGAPATSLAGDEICGPPVSAGQATTGKGTAGQVWVNVFLGSTRIYRFLAVRPSASSGTDGSGVELRYLDYRDRRVLYQAHVPILNVLYDGNACGPYRDWQYQEGMLQASGTNVAPGFLLCPSPAKTILDTGVDAGTFLGTAIYVSGLEVVLVCELQAGWYRYVSEWRLHANGTIRPRFGFDAVSSSCVCKTHHHHVYWRLDFDIQTAGSNAVEEFNDPPIVAGTNWHAKSYEIMRLRSAAHKRRWRVLHVPSRRGYEIVPGANDGTAAGDAYARGDLWFLRYRATELDDYPRVGTEIQVDKYRTPAEPLTGQDVVVWYAGHFTHAPTGPHVSHVVGPELRPFGW